MGKIKRVLMLLLFSINLFALDYSMDIVYGKFTPSDEQNTTSKEYVGIRNSFYFYPEFALQYKYDFVDDYQDGYLHRHTFSFRYQASDIDLNVVPYFEAGVGFEEGSGKDRYMQLTFGSKYFFTNNFNILGEANYIRKEYSSQSYSFGVGVGYDFYRKPTTSRYSEKPISEAVMKKLVKNKKRLKLNLTEDIFLTPY